MAQESRPISELIEALRERYPDVYRHVVGLIRSLVG